MQTVRRDVIALAASVAPLNLPSPPRSTPSPIFVATNSLHVAGILAPERHRIRMLPGFVGGADGSVIGPKTAAALSRLQLDYAFVSCSGVEPEGRVMDFDPGKIDVKRAAMSAATTCVLIATPEKFGRAAREEFATLADFDNVLTGD